MPFAAINPIWFLPLMLPVTIGFWLLITGLVSLTGGWHLLVREFPAIHRPDGLNFRCRSLHIRPLANYNRCINVTLSSVGIYLVPMWIFRCFHAPLLIPWDKVGAMQSRRVGWRTYYSVPIEAGGKSIRLGLPPSAEEWVMRSARPEPHPDSFAAPASVMAAGLASGDVGAPSQGYYFRTMRSTAPFQWLALGASGIRTVIQTPNHE